MRTTFAPPPLRVLVVDDCRDQADSLCVILRLWGHEPAAAYDGASAIGRAADGAFDVVILDLGMPGADGCEVARRVRARPCTAGAFLIAVTGYADAAHRERALRAGFDAYLVKPADPDELEKILAGSRPSGSAAARRCAEPHRLA